LGYILIFEKFLRKCYLKEYVDQAIVLAQHLQKAQRFLFQVFYMKLVPPWTDVYKGLNSSASSSPDDQRSTTDITTPKREVRQLGFCDLCSPPTSDLCSPRGVTFDAKPDGCCSVLDLFRNIFQNTLRE